MKSEEMIDTTLEELDKELAKNNKAPGKHQIIPDMQKECDIATKKYLVKLFNKCLIEEVNPK